jgi:hypothetical protein
MLKIYRLGFREQEDSNRQTASLAGLAVTLLVIVICVFLMKQLHAKSVLEDCLMSGRSNCDLILARLR